METEEGAAKAENDLEKFRSKSPASTVYSRASPGLAANRARYVEDPFKEDPRK